jgi:chromosome partitioning protein
MQCEYYALEGLSALLGTIAKVRQALNPKLNIEGVVLTMFDARNRLSHEIARDVAQHLPADVFQAVIPRNVRLSESPSHGLSVLEYDPKSAGAEAYRGLAAELLARVEGADLRPTESGPQLADSLAPHPEGRGDEDKRRAWSLRALFARSEERARGKAS